MSHLVRQSHILFLWRLAPDDSEEIYEVEDLLTAFDGLQKATRSVFFLLKTCVTNLCTLDPAWHGSTFDGRILENRQREQKESYETQVEGLTLKMDHLQNENSKLQNLFQEKSNVNENIRQEVSRLSSENSVRCRLLESIFLFLGQTRCRTCRDFSLFNVIHRLYQSLNCRFQSCRDKNKNWRPMQRSRAESWQVDLSIGFPLWSSFTD